MPVRKSTTREKINRWTTVTCTGFRLNPWNYSISIRIPFSGRRWCWPPTKAEQKRAAQRRARA